MVRLIIFVLFTITVLTAEVIGQPTKVTKPIQAAMDQVDTNTIRNHIAYLADDKLLGRLPGTPGYQMAVKYVISQFKEMGIAPGGDNGGYTQSVMLRKSVVDNASAMAVLKDASGNIDTLVFSKDFTPVPHPLQVNATGEGKLVFVGYGAEIPGVYSDYTGIDITGKIAVIVTGVPDGLPSTFAAHFSSGGNKMNTAFSKGAAGVVMINLAGRTTPNNNPVLQSTQALNPAKTIAFTRHFSGNLALALNSNKAVLTRLFLNSGKNLESTLAAIKNKQNSSFELPFTLSTSYRSEHTDFESFNVIGVIPGADKTLKNEYVVHSAHLDHLGIGKAVDGDSIYNGAHDNASGVASLLEIARIYKTSLVKHKRSVLITMFTGEEMGQLGSAYFAANPPVPKPAIVANVNTDMPTIIAPLLSVVPLGAEHSTIMQHVQFAAGHVNLDLEKDIDSSQNSFVRSDQYSFVRNGIPALYIKYGNKSNSPGFDMGAYVKAWRTKYYHKPADDINGIFNFAAAKTFVQLNFLVSYSITNTVARPTWNEGDLFGTVKQ